MATTKEVLTRIDGMWITHGEAHQIIGLVADSDPGVLEGALDRMDRIRAAHLTTMTPAPAEVTR